jgi:hypothetical protein
MVRAADAAAAGGQAVKFRTDEGTLRRVRDALVAGGGAPPRYEDLTGPAEELEHRRATWLPRVRPDLVPGPWW